MSGWWGSRSTASIVVATAIISWLTVASVVLVAALVSVLFLAIIVICRSLVAISGVLATTIVGRSLTATSGEGE